MEITKLHIAVGVVRHQSEVLLIERKQREIGSDGNPIIWAFPGGKVEKGETAGQAAVREVFEETKHVVSAAGIITAEDHPHYPVFISYVACKLVEMSGKTPQDDPSIVNSGWAPLVSLRQYFTNHINEKVEACLASTQS